ncbi:MAG: type II toxin-antitoxin system VapC family toxin [Candidatus Accumulibacter phosphatis]|jgi:predicted nucleic acid-binding protein|uniref:type II toxin-antitoxin system VapC family toxin n=1 Tax=Candidatus Accumulibacter TaxID=327159 RepID=UPI0004510529|nr:type II toxin-antitoxin system VapC family toxin [Accumulibacter sp.]MBL8408973.1 type II toxin-antitoxin system VapC family toxin [Accumulibacter sp.]HRF12760.1 type II toxin-antitoxin system VapC family toxin [Candidatus Accumulibacter phosphatis]
MRIVLDASAAANIILRTDLAPALIEKLGQGRLVIAPSLFHSEIANTLWKYVRCGDLSKDTALARYAEAVGLVDAFEADEALATEALSAAIRYSHPVYDLLYVILARRHGCRVLTVDKRLITLAGEIDESLLP